MFPIPMLASVVVRFRSHPETRTIKHNCAQLANIRTDLAQIRKGLSSSPSRQDCHTRHHSVQSNCGGHHIGVRGVCATIVPNCVCVCVLDIRARLKCHTMTRLALCDSLCHATFMRNVCRIAGIVRVGMSR